MEWLLAMNAAIALAEKLAPIVQAQIKSGQVTPEEQQKLRDRLNALRNATAFEGEEWEVPPDSVQPGDLG